MLTHRHATDSQIPSILWSALGKALPSTLQSRYSGGYLKCPRRREIREFAPAVAGFTPIRSRTEVPPGTAGPTHPSVVGFFRRMLGRGDEPGAGALALALWLWVCTTVVAAGAALNGLLMGLATMVAPSANTTAGGWGGGMEQRRGRKERYSNVTRQQEPSARQN